MSLLDKLRSCRGINVYEIAPNAVPPIVEGPSFLVEFPNTENIAIKTDSVLNQPHDPPIPAELVEQFSSDPDESVSKRIVSRPKGDDVE